MNQRTRLKLTHLDKKFGDLVAVNDISFNVQQRRNFRIAGPQRRGKNHADPHDDDADATHFGYARLWRDTTCARMPTACAMRWA